MTISDSKSTVGRWDSFKFLTLILSCVAPNVCLHLGKKKKVIQPGDRWNMIDPFCGKQYTHSRSRVSSLMQRGASVPSYTALWSCGSSLPGTQWSLSRQELGMVSLGGPSGPQQVCVTAGLPSWRGGVICIWDNLFTKTRILISVWLKLFVESVILGIGGRI